MTVDERWLEILLTPLRDGITVAGTCPVRTVSSPPPATGGHIESSRCSSVGTVDGTSIPSPTESATGGFGGERCTSTIGT
ncbi:hypothetical protein Rruber_03713 [Rhodococcus ruber]